MALYEDVNQGAQAAIQQQGHTVGDALGAYSAVTKLQQGKQELELKKQDNERNKAQWLNSQIVAIGRQPEGAARDLMIKGFGQQLPNIVPGANPDIPELFKRDPEMLRKATEAAVHYSQGGAFDPNALNQWFTMNTPEAIEAVNKNAENMAKIKAAQLGGQAMRAQVMQGNQTSAAIDKVTKDDVLRDLSQRIGSAQTMESQLADVRAGRMIDTKQFLGDLSLEYTNMITNSKNAALGKTERTEYSSAAGDLAGVIQKLTKDPTSINSPNIIKQIETGLHSMHHVYARRYDQRADILQRDFRYNPDATSQMRDKIREVKQQFGQASLASGGVSEQISGGAAPPAAEPTSAPSHYEHMSTADLLKEWTAAQQAKAKGGP